MSTQPHQWRKLGQTNPREHLMPDRTYLVPYWMNDGHVAVQRCKKDSICWRNQETPERSSCQPEATDELVVGAITWHTSAVHLDSSRQQREERCTHVYDALVHDQNVHRLNKHITGAKTASVTCIVHTVGTSPVYRDLKSSGYYKCFSIASSKFYYAVSQEIDHKLMSVASSNLNRFSELFTCREIVELFNYTYTISHHAACMERLYLNKW